MGIINRLLRRFGRSQSDAMLTGEEAHGITSEIGMRPTPERQQRLYENGLMGWLVQAATPVSKRGAGGGVIYSWGCYYTQWFYAESYEAALWQVDAWAERMREQDLQEGEK